MPSKKSSSTAAKQPQTQPKDAVVEEQQPAPERSHEDGNVEPQKAESTSAENNLAPVQTKTTQPSTLASSWYGTWPKLSRESVLLETPHKETTSAEGGTTVTPHKEILPRRKPLLSPGSSRRSVPLVATITKLNISSEASKGKEPSRDEGPDTTSTTATVESTSKNDAAGAPAAITGPPEEIKPDQPEVTKVEPASGTMTPTSWLSWSRGDKSIFPSLNASSLPAITAPASTVVANSNDQPVVNQVPEPSVVTDTSRLSVSSSWYPRWVLGGPHKADPVNAVADETAQSSVSEPQDIPLPDASQDNPKPPSEIKRSSWAFWSNSSLQGQNASGQVAVANSTSPLVQEPAEPQKEALATNTEDKRKRPLSQGDEPVRKKQATTPSPQTKKAEEKVKEVKNILLPSFDSTYSVQAENTSIWQQIGNWIYTSAAPKHPTLLKEPRKIKNALAIGVHGYFPASIVQTVIGKPTGTSIKFAESAAKAIETFTQNHGYSPQSIDKIALEGEGRIDERLEILWKLLLNWIEMIRKADFILVACHSQGVPVAISLVAKLIGFGCVSDARIGICAMAGISRGPFAEYKSRWIGGSAAELFEFSDPTSSVSRAYRASLETVLRFGAKIVFVGSLDDQLVPLHSSTSTHVDHPNIYRAVFVDGRIHVPDFISHLVGFALKLRNLSTSDHGLIKELSNPLAGSLVGGEGHSRIYDDPAVYNLAIDFALRTSDVTGPFEADDTPIPTTINPYILPFAMRGVLEEDLVRKDLSEEVIDLLKQFDCWKPSTKVLRDVKYRLEGVRSKL